MTWKIALPMYNVSANIQQHYEAMLDAVIARLRRHGWHDAVELVRGAPLPDFWRRPDMLLSQTCGYPYATLLRQHVTLLATPCYDVPGCAGRDYASVIVVREHGGIHTLADAQGGVVAANDIGSNSGMNALRHTLAGLARDGRFASDVKWSGSHLASLQMVRDGGADIAAIDCVTFAYLKQENPACLAGLSILQYSARSPGLPMITSRAVPGHVAQLLRDALLAPDAPLSASMDALHIVQFAPCTDQDYARVLALESAAQAQGYPVLR